MSTSIIPSAHSRDGYVYVVEFSDSTIKVGKTQTPERRLSQHRSDAAKFGLKVLRVFVSEPHRSFAESEQRLIIHATQQASSVAGAEYFKGVTFDVLVKFVLARGCQPSTPAEIAEDEREDAARVAGFRSLFADPAGIHRVRMVDASLALALSILLDPSMPIGSAESYLPPGGGAAARETIAILAESEDKSREEIEAMSTFDLIEELAVLGIHSARLARELEAIKAGRLDLLAPLADKASA